jgi:hypothetical protein
VNRPFLLMSPHCFFVNIAFFEVAVKTEPTNSIASNSSVLNTFLLEIDIISFNIKILIMSISNRKVFNTLLLLAILFVGSVFTATSKKAMLTKKQCGDINKKGLFTRAG